MTNSIKHYFKDFVLSLVIIFSVITSGQYIAVKIISKSEFYINHILETKTDGNIFDKTVVLLKKDSVFLIKKYLEAVADSMIEFEQLPSFDDIKNFFGLAINSLENNVTINKFKINNNQIILICEFKNKSEIKNFINQIMKMKYIDKVFYNNYTIKNNKYQMEISCVHNN